MRLLLVRHGQTLINTKNLTHYTNDFVSLNPEGRREARLLIPVCKKNKVEMVYSSPEARAVDTAQIISDELKISFKTMEEFRDRQWGQWSGKPWTQIENTLSTMQFNKRFTFIPPGGESWEQMEERIVHGLHNIIHENYECVALVTHEGILRAMLPVLRRTSRQTGLGYEFSNGSVTIFETAQEGMFREIMINDTSHLK